MCQTVRYDIDVDKEEAYCSQRYQFAAPCLTRGFRRESNEK